MGPFARATGGGGARRLQGARPGDRVPEREPLAGALRPGERRDLAAAGRSRATQRRPPRRASRPSGSASADRTGRRRCRAASSSAWRSPRPRRGARAWCWPTSRPGSSTSTTRRSCSRRWRRCAATTTARCVVVTHSERVAARAERVIEMRDGRAPGVSSARRGHGPDVVDRVRGGRASPTVEGRHASPRSTASTSTVDPAERVALWGRSGSGKTTLLHVLGGLVVPSEGRVMWKAQELSSLDDAARGRARARGIAYVFQGSNLLSHFTAFENVAFAREVGTESADARPEGRGQADGSAGYSPEDLLELVGLSSKLDSLPSELSGGEAQRVADRTRAGPEPGAAAVRRAHRPSGLRHGRARPRSDRCAPAGVLLLPGDRHPRRGRRRSRRPCGRARRWSRRGS